MTLALTSSTPSAIATPSGSTGTDDEGGTPALRKKLDEASRAYANAKARLDASKKRQTRYTEQLEQTELRLAELDGQVQELAAHAYRNGPLTPAMALLDSASPDDLIERAVSVDMLARSDDAQLRAYRAAHTEAVEQKALIDNEVKIQTRQVFALEKAKKKAEQALASAGGGGSTSGLVSYNSPAAKPAPRNSDGSWPAETCSVDDPTTSGCITPRTSHALRQARAAGFTRYVSCYRSGGSGEHPKGRACDFSPTSGGFENANASGADKTYGDKLAAYFVKNASALGVMYVIWYGRIWMASTGWRTYSGCCDPASTHKNHIHLSML